jgi:hypothetical protein
MLVRLIFVVIKLVFYKLWVKFGNPNVMGEINLGVLSD